MASEPYVVLNCPLCDRSSLHPSADVSKDRLVRAIAQHVLEEHPGTAPLEAESALESAVEGPPVETFETDAVEPRRWVLLDG